SALSFSASVKSARRFSSNSKTESTGEESICRFFSAVRTTSGVWRMRLMSIMVAPPFVSPHPLPLSHRERGWGEGIEYAPGPFAGRASEVHPTPSGGVSWCHLLLRPPPPLPPPPPPP